MKINRHLFLKALSPSRLAAVLVFPLLLGACATPPDTAKRVKDAIALLNEMSSPYLPSIYYLWTLDVDGKTHMFHCKTPDVGSKNFSMSEKYIESSKYPGHQYRIRIDCGAPSEGVPCKNAMLGISLLQANPAAQKLAPIEHWDIIGNFGNGAARSFSMQSEMLPIFIDASARLDLPSTP